MNTRRQGCLAGIAELFLLDRLFDWLQRKFGYKSGSCFGCGCGLFLAIIFILIVISIVFRTDWFKLF